MRSKKLIAVSAFVTATLFVASPLLAQNWFGGSGNQGSGWGGGQSPRGGHQSGNNNNGLEKAIVGGIFGALEQGIRASNNNNHHDHHDHRDRYDRYDRYDRQQYYPQQQQYYPQQQYYSAPAPTRVVPAAPKNVAPKKNAAPVKKVVAAKNQVFNTASFLSLTNQDIARANEKLQAQQEKELDEIEADLAGALPPSDTDLITQMTNAGIDPVIQQQILDAKRKGDAGTVQILFGKGAPGHEAEAADLAKKINLQNNLNDLRDQNQNGKLTERDLDRFTDDVKNILPPGPDRDHLLDHLADMGQTVQVQELLNDAVPNPGMNGLGGGSVTVIHNPNLPSGTVINLGNGAVMVGTGGNGNLNVSTSTLAGAMGLPVAQSLPVPESDAKIPTSGVVLRNASKNGDEIAYVINDKFDYSMKAGHLQSLGDGKWIITYDRGDSFGEARYTLSKGTYEFTPGDNGWALVSKKYNVEIDNSGNPNEFNYVVNNVASVVGPYSVKTHDSAYPIEVRFDRGDGKGEDRKVLDGGAFQVAVSPNDNLWDLYSTDGSPVLAGDASGGLNLFGN